MTQSVPALKWRHVLRRLSTPLCEATSSGSRLAWSRAAMCCSNLRAPQSIRRCFSVSERTNLLAEQTFRQFRTSLQRPSSPGVTITSTKGCLVAAPRTAARTAEADGVHGLAGPVADLVEEGGVSQVHNHRLPAIRRTAHGQEFLILGGDHHREVAVVEVRAVTGVSEVQGEAPLAHRRGAPGEELQLLGRGSSTRRGETLRFHNLLLNLVLHFLLGPQARSGGDRPTARQGLCPRRLAAGPASAPRGGLAGTRNRCGGPRTPGQGPCPRRRGEGAAARRAGGLGLSVGSLALLPAPVVGAAAPALGVGVRAVRGRSRRGLHSPRAHALISMGRLIPFLAAMPTSPALPHAPPSHEPEFHPAMCAG